LQFTDGRRAAAAVGDTAVVLVIAHRGASEAERENTPAAFGLADAMGADAVELDVRYAPGRADGGRLVVHHDPLPDDARALDALASLGDALDACGRRMLVNVEIKNSPGDPDHDPTQTVAAAVVEELRRHGEPWRWLISSFAVECVDACRRLAPELNTAVLCVVATDDLLDRAVAAGHRAVHPQESTVDAALIERCAAHGLSLNAWTCNDAGRIAQLDALGTDGVCTDRPDMALAALGRPGAELSPRWFRDGGTPAGSPPARA
jgi:glycerophosphoryl diester phosphodiesterase